MKTVLLALEFPPAIGGTETYYSNLAQYWPDECAVIDNQKAKLINKYLPFLKWLPAFKTMCGLKTDWLLVGEILPLGTAAYLASFFVNLRFAVFLHGLDFSLTQRSFWKKFLAKRILKRANLILCANSRTAELAAAFLKSDVKIRLANPGVDPVPTVVRPELLAGLRQNYVLEDKLILLTIGRLVKRKGVDIVLKSLPQVLNQEKNLHYIIIGQGPEAEYIQKLIDELKLDQTVTLLPNVREEEKWAWLALSDIFIMTAREINGDYEGFGIVYLEANSFGKPVIAGKSGGVRDAVINGINGLIVDPNNETEISQAILRLARDKVLRDSLGEQGKKRAQAEFNWPRQVKKIYDSLISL